VVKFQKGPGGVNRFEAIFCCDLQGSLEILVNEYVDTKPLEVGSNTHERKTWEYFNYLIK